MPRNQASRQRQHVLLLVEVGREGERQDHLRKLRWLHRVTSDVDPNPRAALFDAKSRHQGQHQQPETEQEQQVGEPLHHPVVAQEHDDQ